MKLPDGTRAPCCPQDHDLCHRRPGGTDRPCPKLAELAKDPSWNCDCAYAQRNQRD
jgi:hypothetical protein